MIRFLRPKILSRFTSSTTATPETPAESTDAVFPTSNSFINDSPFSNSFKGVSESPFSKEIAEILSNPIQVTDIEIKPDGILYLPEIKYRRVLNKAFGPGAWGLVPRGPHTTLGKTVSREYALFCLGRFVSSARGEQDYYNDDDLATKSEGVKSNSLMRCCKDLGIASELWDPGFINSWKKEHAVQVMVAHASKGTRNMLWRRRDRTFEYPFREESSGFKK